MKRYLKVTYDVTGLSDEQVGELTIAAVVQAERKKPSFEDEVGYPDVPVVDELTYVYEDEEG